MKLVEHSYKDSCIYLLKDLTNCIKEMTVEEKETLIANGVSYSEMISKESAPSAKSNEIFKELVEDKGEDIAHYIALLAEGIYTEKKENLVLVSLARAGTPFGILIKRYLMFKYHVNVAHYSVSIIRGKGIDENALKFILNQFPEANIQFIDGWTGKGSIINELKKSVSEFNQKNNTMVDTKLAVLADPAKRCELYGTRTDLNIPNCCLNSTVSGLVSRTIYNKTYINQNDFHGAITLDRLASFDMSSYFIEAISDHFPSDKVTNPTYDEIDINYATSVLQRIKEDYHVKDINKIKLSIGEATRVLLRRKARVLLLADPKDLDVKHLIQLAKEKNVPIKNYVGGEYKAIAIIDESRG